MRTTRRDRREGQEHRRKGWGEHRKDKAVLSRKVLDRYTRALQHSKRGDGMSKIVDQWRKENTPTSKGYQVIGHYKNIKYDRRNSRNISDGTVFIKRYDAVRFANERMHTDATIREIDNPTDYCIPLDFSAWRCVRVCFENGEHLITEINGTLESIEKYYIGQYFNMGPVGVENMTRGTCVQLDPCRGTYTEAYDKSIRTWE